MSYCHFCLQKINRFNSLYTCNCEGKDGVFQIHWTCDQIRKKKYNSPDCADCGEKFVLCNNGVQKDEYISVVSTFVAFAVLTFLWQSMINTRVCVVTGTFSCDFAKLMGSILGMGTVLSLTWMIVDFVYLVSALIVFYTLDIIS
jgi:hypothetical protein